MYTGLGLVPGEDVTEEARQLYMESGPEILADLPADRSKWTPEEYRVWTIASGSALRMRLTPEQYTAMFDGQWSEAELAELQEADVTFAEEHGEDPERPAVIAPLPPPQFIAPNIREPVRIEPFEPDVIPFEPPDVIDALPPPPVVVTPRPPPALDVTPRLPEIPTEPPIPWTWIVIGGLGLILLTK